MKNIEKFLKDNLDGKSAYVSSGGLLLEGEIEQKCFMIFKEFRGIHCYAELEYNEIDIAEDIRQLLNKNRQILNLSYDQKDEIAKILIPAIKKSKIKIGIQ